MIGMHSAMHLMHPNYCHTMYVSWCVFVGSCLVAKVFIGDLPATGRGWVITKLANDEQRSNTNKSVT